MSQPTQLEQRLQHLEAHLAQRNPILLQVVTSVFGVPCLPSNPWVGIPGRAGRSLRS